MTTRKHLTALPVGSALPSATGLPEGYPFLLGDVLYRVVGGAFVRVAPKVVTLIDEATGTDQTTAAGGGLVTLEAGASAILASGNKRVLTLHGMLWLLASAATDSFVRVRARTADNVTMVTSEERIGSVPTTDVRVPLSTALILPATAADLILEISVLPSAGTPTYTIHRADSPLRYVLTATE